MTFRETVEEIQACNDWRHCKVRGKMCYECRIDRIMEAYKALVEGMPEPECLKVGDKGLNNLVFLGAKEHHLACKKFMLEGLE